MKFLVHIISEYLQKKYPWCLELKLLDQYLTLDPLAPRPHVTWWQQFITLAIHVFSLPFFLNAKSPIFAVGFFEKSPELTKDPKRPLFAT